MPDKYCTVIHRISVPPVSDNTNKGAILRVLLSDLRYGRNQSDSAPAGHIVTASLMGYPQCYTEDR